MAVAANVKRGAHFLDERLPNWRSEINLDELSLQNGDKCVLGQLFGDYDRGSHLLDVSWEKSAKLGFRAAPNQSYVNLNDDWRKVLA